MATPLDTDFIISQGDSLPDMRIAIPPNSDGQLIDLTDCTVTFLGRPVGARTTPPPIVRPIQSFASETEDGVGVVAVYVHFETTDTKAVSVGASQTYQEMEGELEIADANNDVLTIPSEGYLTWYIRDDIGGAS